jgi:hypothetical protein
MKEKQCSFLFEFLMHYGKLNTFHSTYILTKLPKTFLHIPVPVFCFSSLFWCWHYPKLLDNTLILQVYFCHGAEICNNPDPEPHKNRPVPHSATLCCWKSCSHCIFSWCSQDPWFCILNTVSVDAPVFNSGSGHAVAIFCSSIL